MSTLYRPREVLIEPPAFISMLMAVLEVFHYEAFGLLLGNRGEERWVVEHAVPLQTAERSLYGVSPKLRREERLKEISKILGIGLELIGDFHSHTQIGKSKAKAKPSSLDLGTMEPGNIYIIVAVNEAKKRMPWSNLKNGDLSGTVGGFAVRFSAFSMLDERRYTRLKVLCPIATGIHGET